MHPFRVILHSARSDLLVGSDADVIHSDNVDHFFEAIDEFFETGEEVPYPDRSARFGNCPRVIVAYLPASERRRSHRRRSRKCRVRQEQRLGCDLNGCLDGILGGMRHVADKAEPMARTDDLRTK
jgi:hypothetical protein